MLVRRLIVDPLGSNTYLVADGHQGSAAVIDPGRNVDIILYELEKLETVLVAIINTHGHVDHMSGNKELKRATSAPIMTGSSDSWLLTDAEANLSAPMGIPVVSPPPDRLLCEHDIIHVGSLMFTVLETPGHTEGGICLQTGNVLFTGDTLFLDSIGRVDLPGGSYHSLMEAIATKILCLPDETHIYPGHGPDATLGEIRQVNPFVHELQCKQK